ncbi:MAG: hypothetical protein C5B47_08015 [Verrucomicrobia bacterium]|nr:MAG: hypothetical protein C5B47_08015 [Verrucomicrobiota bacterium]
MNNFLQYILLGIAGISSFYFLFPPENWIGASVCLAFAIIIFLLDRRSKIIVRIAGISWKHEDFVRGWLITGRTGCGKTQAAINRITYQVFKNVKNWGGICLDQKGLYWEILVKMSEHFGRRNDLVLLQTRPLNAPADWKPSCSINITGDPNVPSSTYAKVICDTAQSLTGKSQSPFFPARAQLAIQAAFDVLRFLGYPATIPNVYGILRTPTQTDKVRDEFNLVFSGRKPEEEEEASDFQKKARAILEAFESHFNQPADQRGGVDGTIDTFLGFFLDPEVADVFCADKPTFSIGEMDKGKIVCIALAQKYQTERLYINTILKLSYYFHAFSRFDKPEKNRKDDNLLILFADEGQEILTGAESAFADHRAAGIIREAKCTIVLATQAYSSILAALDERYAKVFMLNMSNEIILTVADYQSAEIAEHNIGEHKIVKRSWSWGQSRSFNYSDAVEAFYQRWQLRKLPKFTAIVRHCEKGHRKCFIAPINPDGSYPTWFLNSHPHYWIIGGMQHLGRWIGKFFQSKESLESTQTSKATTASDASSNNSLNRKPL